MVCDKVVCERWCENQHRAPPGGSVYCTFPGKLVCHTKASRGPAAATRAAAPQGSSVYCACHTKASRGPAAATRAAAPPGGSVYRACHSQPRASVLRPATRQPAAGLHSACHTTASRGPAAATRQEALYTPPATRQPAAGQRRPRAQQLLQEICVLRLPHDSQPPRKQQLLKAALLLYSGCCGCIFVALSCQPAA